MLISVTLENWMSFNEPVTFSMVAGNKRRFLSRVPKLKKQKMRVLPIAAIFGANASGKSNFFKAVEFAKYMVTKNPKDEKSGVDVVPYKLIATKLSEPSCFEFELLINEAIYKYSFSATKEKIVKESLFKLNGDDSEELQFERVGQTVEFGSAINTKSELNVISNGTNINQLFIQNCASQKRDEFRFIYNWFRRNLITISPYTSGQLDSREDFSDINDLLESLDLGFKLSAEEIDANSLPMFDHFKDRFLTDLPEEEYVPYPLTSRGEYITIFRNKEKFLAIKSISQRLGEKGENVNFQISEESDGSQRVLELLPAFLMLKLDNFQRTIIVDELDRSLHSLITRQLLEDYLKACSEESRSQLIFTTHDVMLMSRDYLREDEMWIVDKKRPGDTDTYRIDDFTDIKDKEDVRHTYLSGRLGGVPRLMYAYF